MESRPQCSRECSTARQLRQVGCCGPTGSIPSATASTGTAGDLRAGDLSRGTVDHGEVWTVSIRLQNLQGLRADLERDAPREEVMVIVLRLSKRACEDRIVPFPDTRNLLRKNRAQARIGCFQRDRRVGQEKQALER